MSWRFSTQALAGASARRPWLVIGGWLAALLVGGALVVGFLGGAVTSDDDFTNNPESKRADTLIAERFAADRSVERGDVDEIVVVHSDRYTVDDPAFREQVESIDAAVRALGRNVVADGSHYYQER